MIAGARRFIDAPSQGDRHKAFSPFPYEWESQHLDHPRGTPRARDLDEPADGLLLSQGHDQRERAVRKYTAMLAADQKEARSFLRPHLSSLVKGTTQERFGRRVVEDEGARRIRQEKRGYQVTGELAR